MLERSWQYRENKLHNLKFFSFEFPCNVIKSLCLVWVFSDKNSEEFCGILQATILEWVAIPFSRRFSQTRDQTGSPTLQAGSLPAESSGKPKNTGVGSLCLLQRIFPTQELNQGLLHCRQILYQLSHKGSPRTLEWVAYAFSSGSSRPRNRTGVSCIAGRCFTNWATKEAFKCQMIPQFMWLTYYWWGPC